MKKRTLEEPDLDTVRLEDQVPPPGKISNSFWELGRYIYVQQRLGNTDCYLGDTYLPYQWVSRSTYQNFGQVQERTNLTIRVLYHPVMDRVLETWISNRDQFEQYLKSCRVTGKRMAMGFIHIMYYEHPVPYDRAKDRSRDVDLGGKDPEWFWGKPEPDSHHNAMVIDTKYKTLERFEPHGDNPVRRPYWNEAVDRALREWSDQHNLTYMSAGDICPSREFGPQSLQGAEELALFPERKQQLEELYDQGYQGSCSIWSCWYLFNRVLNPDVMPRRLINNLLRDVDQGNEEPFTIFVRDYHRNIQSILTHLYYDTVLNNKKQKQ
jgi:hypothetical protein